MMNMKDKKLLDLGCFVVASECVLINIVVDDNMVEEDHSIMKTLQNNDEST